MRARDYGKSRVNKEETKEKQKKKGKQKEKNDEDKKTRDIEVGKKENNGWAIK